MVFWVVSEFPPEIVETIRKQSFRGFKNFLEFFETFINKPSRKAFITLTGGINHGTRKRTH